MDPDRRINTAMPLGEFNRQAVGFDWSDRADRNDRRDPGQACSCDYSVNVVAQAGIGEMAMAVDEVH
jgi:hypothetical protein